MNPSATLNSMDSCDTSTPRETYSGIWRMATITAKSLELMPQYGCVTIEYNGPKERLKNAYSRANTENICGNTGAIGRR